MPRTDNKDVLISIAGRMLNVRQSISAYSVAIREIALGLMKSDMEAQVEKYGGAAKIDTKDIVRRSQAVLVSRDESFDWVAITEDAYRKHMADVMAGRDARKAGKRETQTSDYLMENHYFYEYVGQKVSIANGTTSKFLRQVAATQGWGTREWSKYIHLGLSASQARRLAVQKGGNNTENDRTENGGVSAGITLTLNIPITVTVSQDSIAALRDIIAQLGLK